MMTDDSVLKHIWTVETEILDVFHSFCVENKIQYSLGFGTLLGAIRHKGFIPWDDDVDIIMTRPEYDKFINLWQEKRIDGYILQNEYEVENDNGDNFCKLRKDNTTFLENVKEKERKHHKGIFIDIFPVDRVASTSVSKRIQFFCSLIYMLYYRNYADQRTGIYGLGQKILLSLPSKTKEEVKKKAFMYMTKWNSYKENQLYIPCTFAFCKRYYPANLLEEVELTEFNGKKYYRTKNFDDFLKVMYGDYMQMPPENERIWKHHPILVDFEHNYETLKEEA